MKVKFPEDNSIMFFQDMRMWEGVPSNVTFEMEIDKDGRVTLTAPGYGEIGGEYGNGSLLLRFGNTNGLLGQIKKEIGDLAYDAIVSDIKRKIIQTIT